MGGAAVDPTLALDMDFATNGSFLDSVSASSTLVTHTRTTTGTYFDSSGVLQTAAINTARFDYNPLTLAVRGLLLEETRTNVVLHNRDLTNAAWTKSNVSEAKDQTGIDGVANSASRITASAGNGTCLQSITLASSARFHTAYVKRLVGTGNIDLTMNNGTTWTTVTTTDGWTRVSIPSATLANPVVGFRIVTSGDSIAVDYVQNENGAFETSAIATTTVAVQRTLDNAAMTGTNFSNWYNQSEGTVVLDFMANAITTDRHFLNINNAADAERIILSGAVGSLNATAVIVDSSAIQANLTLGLYTPLATSKMALAMKLNDVAACLNGGTVQPDVVATMPTPTQLQFFRNPVGNANHPGQAWYRRLRYYDVAKGDAEIQALTT
jgi:hypothetical protein